MENFINDFKIYCENAEDTKGLEIIQRCVINQFYCLETFVSDNYDIGNDDIEEGFRLSKLLYELANEAKKIKEINKSEVWKIFNIVGIKDISSIDDIIWDALVESCEFLYEKYNLGDDNNLTDEIVEKEKWYKDLCLLGDKYFKGSWIVIE